MSKKKVTSLVWFRNNLRVLDNISLTKTIEESDKTIGFINIDPNDFNQDEEKVLALAENIYEKYSQCENYVCNVGSGITPDIDPNKVGLFLQRLRVLNSK